MGAVGHVGRSGGAALAMAAVGVGAMLLPTQPADAASAGTHIALSRTAIAPSGAFKVTGKVPATSWRTVVLQANRTGTWKRVATSSTSRAGAFAFKTKAPARLGKVSYRVHAARVARHTMAAVTTRTVTLNVINPLGTLTNPYRLGQTFRLGGWVVQVNNTNYNAYAQMDPEMTDPPAPGWTFISNEATYTYRGSGGSSPSMDLHFDFLAADHRVYNNSAGSQLCIGPDPGVFDLTDMYAGATTTAHECAVVPTTLAHDGLWRFEEYAGSEVVFVRAR